ncbi:tryptophan synthase alpha chain [Motilibacter peucedani]|uniref:Tryptophan synthase alpha chain n=1 Tax=Motilibacter peucedani TaxID=598650 RepID=A0A420XVD3_9ACTN|nr:tryptophan synthase subunit alpha [Motilibacter peucedani]RKS84248.1 tryptophan synthase alpha chain [Motilibacter peucedani]
MSVLSERLAAVRGAGRAALVGYLPAGFPSRADSAAALQAMVEGGVDVVEIGLPYSDPVLDGPVIQEAVDRALSDGTTPLDVFADVAAVAATGTPALVMTYWNPIERIGPQRFAEMLVEAGGAGVILPDLPPEEASAWTSVAASAGLDSVFLVAPSSSEDRIAKVAAASSGFVYAASLMGVTGVRSSLSGTAAALVERVRARTELPVCVGLGVSTPEQAREVAGYADGVIVGSAFVRRFLDAPDAEAGRTAARELAGALREGIASASAGTR